MSTSRKSSQAKAREPIATPATPVDDDAVIRMPIRPDIALAMTCIRHALGHRISDRSSFRVLQSDFKPLYDSIVDTVGERGPGKPESESTAAARRAWIPTWLDRARNHPTVDVTRISLAIDAAWSLVADEPDEPEINPATIQHATLADAINIVGSMSYLWELWIPNSAMTLLAAKAGIGKTRLAMDLAKRLWLGLDMPDGSPNPFPKGTKTLWHLADRNWAETGTVAENFGMPTDAILLTSLADDPLTTPELDELLTLERLEAQIVRDRPGFVVIDTMTYATGKNTTRAEEAKVAFDGLLNVAGRTGVAILALTHLNSSGEALGRRIEERARSVITLSTPDPEGQPDRRKLWVSKSACKKPEKMGVSLFTHENTYDLNPPIEPAEPQASARGKGPEPDKSVRFAEWLRIRLQNGPVMLATIIDDARAAGLLEKPTSKNPDPSRTPLYNARDRLPTVYPGLSIVQYEATEEGHRRAVKFYKLVRDGDPDGLA